MDSTTSKKEEEEWEEEFFLDPKYKNPQTPGRDSKTSSLRRPASQRKKTPRTPPILYQSSRQTKKQDRLSLFLQRAAQWDSTPFLKATKGNSREGRKLNLVKRFKKRPFEIVKSTSIQDFIPPQYQPPHQKRRDEIRLKTRAKFI